MEINPKIVPATPSFLDHCFEPVCHGLTETVLTETVILWGYNVCFYGQILSKYP